MSPIDYRIGRPALAGLLLLASLFLGCSNVTAGTPTVTPGPGPTGLSAQPKNARISLTWTAVTGASEYRVYRSTVSGALGALAGTSSTASFSDTAVTNGTAYYYTVTAVTAAGESAGSSPLGAAASLDRIGLAHGADISWTTWLETSRGVTWADAAGTVTAPEVLLAHQGFDAVRLRVMVNPSVSTGVGYADTASVATAAQRFVAGGLKRVLVDLHLSDTWADPGHQAVPAAWKYSSGTVLATPAELATNVAAHVTAVLTALKNAGVTPEWVQMGNEETNGVLWPNLAKVTGNSNWVPLATVLNAGYDAVKAFNPAIQVVLHIDKGGEASVSNWWFSNYKLAGGKWDVIGLSFYPYWQPGDTVAMLQANMNALVSTYSTPVMVVEVGGLETDAPGTQLMLAQVKNAVASVPNNQGLGVFYWEPEGNASVNGGYKLGATAVSGSSLRFTDALAGLGYSP